LTGHAIAQERFGQFITGATSDSQEVTP